MVFILFVIDASWWIAIFLSLSSSHFQSSRVQLWHFQLSRTRWDCSKRLPQGFCNQLGERERYFLAIPLALHVCGLKDNRCGSKKPNCILSKPQTPYLKFSGMRNKEAQHTGSWPPTWLQGQLLKTQLKCAWKVLVQNYILVPAEWLQCLFIVTLVPTLNARDLGECETQIPTDTFAWYFSRFWMFSFWLLFRHMTLLLGSWFRNSCVLHALHYIQV